MGTLKELISTALAEEGYIEKQSNKDLDSKTANKGNQNYTKYARDVNVAGLMGCQGQPWCCTFQFWLEMQEFGVEKALQHWNMTRDSYVGYNCFATYNAFKKAGKIGATPRLGAVVIFNFSHAGRVVKMYSKNGRKWWDCLEGNTSSNLSDRNGGQVKIKTRPWNDSSVKGFCYVDYDDELPEYEIGWHHDRNGWWYADTENSYYKNCWQVINGHKYYFNLDGYALKNWNQIDGKWYYFENTDGHPLECALYVSDKDGAQGPGEF